MGNVQHGDASVAFGDDGSGEPLVLLHGTTSSRDSFQLVTPALVGHLRIVCPEMPGSGQTFAPDRHLEIDELVAQTVAVADHLGLERFHVGGWSLGAVVAAAVAAAVGPRVKSLTIINGWATTDARMRFTFDLWARLIETDPSLFARYAFADGMTLAGHEAMGAMLEALVGVTADGLAPGSLRQIELDGRVDIADRLAAIVAPTLVIGGIEDRWVDIAHSRQLASSITGARLVELACGHLIPTEQAAELAELLLAHVDSHR